MDRNFKGIWIPKEIWLDKELGWIEKLFLVEIDSLDNENGCFASNKYFADFFDLSKVRVSNIISQLVKKGYITIQMTYKPNSKQIDKRVLKKTLLGNKTKKETPIKEKYKDNNKDLNNSFNKILPLKEHEKFDRRKYGPDELEQYYQDVTK
jgi:hypothetical protein